MPSLPDSTTESASAKLQQSLDRDSKLQFNFSGFFLIIGFMVRSASVFSLGFIFYLTAAIEGLLAGCFSLGTPMRQRLGSFYTFGLLVPVAGIVWCVIDRVRLPTVPPWDWMVSAGVCAVVININEARIMAKYRAPDVPLGQAMAGALRANLPQSLSVVGAGIVTVASQSPWIDILVALGIALSHLGAPHLLKRLAEFDVGESGTGGAVAYQLAITHPRLGILLTPAWQEGAAAVRRKAALRRSV